MTAPPTSTRFLYFATELEGCFAETLARLPAVAEVVGSDWRARHFMAPGNVPADWRHRRLAVHAALEAPDQLFLDVEALETRRLLERHLRGQMAALGVSEIDVPAIRGGDRRLTRLASLWAWRQVDEDGARRYAGIRYLSRLSSEWECWAVFEGTGLRELRRREVGRDMDQLQSIARRFGLTIH